MNLTVQFSQPSYESLNCGHCDDRIIRGEDLKYVRFSLGKTTFNFHENCFGAIMLALNKFQTVFIQERHNDENKRRSN